ncbi:MAG: hypothetical protein NT133_09560 [Alphaproteobacteria bacterium]|nr:hypothetical protein [Alphaproteobacteria bacterium]
MSDEVARIFEEGDFDEIAGVTPAAPTAENPSPGDLLDAGNFDEQGYLRLNPDVAASIDRGEFASGHQHYLLHGFREGRNTPSANNLPRNRLLRPTALATQAATPLAEIPFNVEAVLASSTGAIFIVGWVDDTASPVETLRIGSPNWRIVLDASSIIRIRRGDVENALGRPIVHRFGFIGFVYTDQTIENAGSVMVHATFANGGQVQSQVACRPTSEIELRNILLTRLADADFHGNPCVERIACLDGGMGDQIIAFNRAITRRLVANPYMERFGPTGRRLRGSIVVALYGKAEYLHAQNALYAGLPGIEDYEFIYVSNSPELGETLMREAKIGSYIYDIAQTVMVLPGNAGFGAANNIALAAARSDRILNVNPDVFPRDPDWAAKHTALIDSGEDGTRLFGVPLYYDDGSLMHGGMYFEADEAISIVEGGFTRRRMLRTEHYGKGAPPDGTPYMRPRPVPAVTGAFISSERAWYERLGGFSEDFVFGHYEDADLCLKSLEQGVPSWLKDIRLWHFEGKGSTRLPPHEGGSIVNRWLFSRRWDEMLTRDLLGAAPANAHFAGGV